ncbi:MAG: transglycosylase SLT domain-containing protein [Alphaproteobacteria bacterium]|nr:transglycosylase SLT domain-containing protein [Alphaproteobacteria bacterium]
MALACLILQEPAQANPCKTAAIHVAWETKTPLHILNAISKVESAFNPYAFNTEGTPRRFNIKSQAAIYLRRMIEEKRSVDVGCMQMNIRWHLQRFERPEDMLDPLANMRAAQLYLNELRRQCGDWECAAGAFHNMRDPAANRRYRCKLASELNPQGNYHYCN